MKSIKFYLSFVLIAIATTASAQFVNSGNNTSTLTGHTRKADTEGWNRISLSFNPTKITVDMKGADDLNLTGFSFGYAKGISIAKQVPLFLEAGINAQFAFKKFDSEDAKEAGINAPVNYDCETKFSTMNLNVPLNLAYKFNVGTVSIVPYAGINLKINVIGKKKYSLEKPEDLEHTSYKDEDDFWKEMEEENDIKQNINMFDKKETGNKNSTWKRFQMGWQIGIGLNYNHLYVGAGYTKDFMELCKKTKVGYASITLGYNF